MSEFFPEIEIKGNEAEAIARGLYAVARADGEVQEGEAAMIGEFYNSTTDHHSELGDLARAPQITAASLAAMLPSPELRHVFIKTALLLAYVDGVYAPGEAKLIAEFAKALEVTDLKQLEAQVKEYLVGHLTHLHNVHGVAEVAKGLKV